MPGNAADANGGEATDLASAQPTPGLVVRIDTTNGILVETGNGLLALRRLQLQSRKPLDWKSFLNGVQDFVGAVLGGS